MSITLEEYLKNVPLLHYWGTPPVWNNGGFDAGHFSKLHDFIDAQLPAWPKIAETGAGNSTIFFLLHTPERLVSIDPFEKIYERIANYCKENEIDATKLEKHVGPSYRVLPPIAERSPQSFDLVLIDGDHGWPGVMVDFCYAIALLKPGAYLMLDDLNIYSIAELARFIEKQPGFALRVDLGKAKIYCKDFDSPSLPGWWLQPYITEKT